MGTVPPSWVALRATPLGLSLTAEKHCGELRLQLRLPGPNPQLGSVLSDWTTEDGLRFERSVSPEGAETTIVELAALVRPLLPPASATPTPGPPGAA